MLRGPGSMFQVEGIELLANALEDHPSLQSLVVARPLILGILLPLFLRLLRANDALVFECRLETFELRSGHGCVVDFAKARARAYVL